MNKNTTYGTEVSEKQNMWHRSEQHKTRDTLCEHE